MNPDNPDRLTRPEAKLLNLPREMQEEIWELRVKDNPKDKVMTLIQISKWIQAKHDIKVGKSTVGNFFVYLRDQKRFEAAADCADQFKTLLQKNPDISKESIDTAAQLVFTSESMRKGDANAYVAVAKLGILREIAAAKREDQAIAREKLSAAAKTKIDIGLDALADAIKGNVLAEKLYAELKEVVRNA